MSEYQYIEFRAVDRPLTDKELAFADKQSSRAEISRLCFSVEYNYSSFGGDVDGMLRRGYDVFLDFSNYGNRIIKIRLPDGLPFSKKVCSQFIDGERLKWKKDSKGEAGILTLEPFYEQLEYFSEVGDCLDAVVGIRQQLMSGDLRALYVLWLCVAGDHNHDWSEVIEPPVPCGLQEFDLDVDALFQFFEIDPFLFNAAAGDPALATTAMKTSTPAAMSPSERIKPWLKSLNAKQAKEHIEQMLVGDVVAVKAEILAAIARDRGRTRKADWPTVELKRTFEELVKCTEAIRAGQQVKEEKKQAAKAKRDAAKIQRVRENRMAEMAKDPKKWLLESERLADARGTFNYRLAAEILADLREAVGGTRGEKIARSHAAHLVHKHPTLTQLKGSLRKSGVLDG